MNSESQPTLTLSEAMSTMNTLATRVAKVCELEKPNLPAIEESDELDSMRQGLLGDEGIDALGCYHAQKHRIVIYTEKCRQLASTEHLSLENVIGVVLIHEMAHAVHYSRVLDARKTETAALGKWNALEKKLREELAQEVTVVTIKKHYPDLWETFKHVSEKSPKDYQGYHNDIATAKQSLSNKMIESLQVRRNELLDMGE